MMNYPLIGQRLFNTPLMLRPDKCEIVVAALLDHFGIAKLNRVDGTSMGVIELRQSADDWMEDNEPAESKPYQVINGVGVIPVQGSLCQRVAGLRPYSGCVGYNQIERMLEMAMDDRAVKSILFDHDSGGGEVAGCFDLARKIRNYNGKNGGKPMVAAINEQCCSADYALASGCDEIYMPETGICGSIGVWTMLVDMTRALDQDGISVTMVRAGERKARGGPYEKADKATYEKLMAWVESTRVQFATLVAEARGLSVEDVLGQEGDWYHGEEALTLGLVDGIGPFEAIFARAQTLAQ